MIRNAGGFRARCLVFVALAVIVTGIGSGCSVPLRQPRDVAEPSPASGPADIWPAEWRHRRLFDRVPRLIYAASNAALREAEKSALIVADEFAKTTGGGVTNGVILVTDANDPMPLDDTKRLYMLIAAARVKRPMIDTDDATQSPDAAYDKESADAAKIGLTIDDLLRGTAYPLDPPQLADLSFAAEAARHTEWVVVLPTRAACRHSAGRMLDAVMRHPDMNVGQRILIAPWLPLMRSAATDEPAALREVVLVEELIRTQSWNDAEKTRWREHYRAKYKADQDKRVEAKKKEVGAASQPRTK